MGFNKALVSSAIMAMSKGQYMPLQKEWNRNRGDLPTARTIVNRWDKSWHEIGIELGLRGARRTVSIDHLREDIIRLYASGLGAISICRRLSVEVSNAYLLAKLKEWGVEPRPLSASNLGGTTGMRARKNKASIINYYEGGCTTKQIGEMYGIHPNSIARYLRSWGANTTWRSKGTYRHDIDERRPDIERMIAEGETLASIAEEIGTTSSAISTRLSRWGIRTIG